MDTSRKVNSNAGKGGRYSPGEVGERFGRPNMVGKGAGISPRAVVPTQAHAASGRGGTSAPADMSTQTEAKRATSPGNSPGNSRGPQGGGLKTTWLDPGDKQRRG